MKRVAIIGAGISGLSMANMLKNEYDVVVYERRSTVGGLLRCETVEGSLFHTCGGHVFNTRNREVGAWFWSFFHPNSQWHKAERNSAIWFEDPVSYAVPYPIENHIYRLPEDIQNRVVSDLFKIHSRRDSTSTNFGDFLRHRFGDTLYEIYFNPYNLKVWRQELDSIPLSWLEGKLPMPSVEEIIINNFNHVEEKEFVHSTFWYEKIGGSQLICDTMARGLDIRLNASVDSISKTRGGKWLINNDIYDIIVFCGNIKELPGLLSRYDIGQFVNEIENLKYHGTTSVFCEIDSNPYSWLYLPSDAYESHRIICTGNFSPSNNSSLLFDNRITATAEFTNHVEKDEIEYSLSRMPLHPHYITHKYNKFTYPIQEHGTRELIGRLKQRLELDGLFLVGRFAEWEYYNMDAAIASAMKTKNKIIAYSYDKGRISNNL